MGTWSTMVLAALFAAPMLLRAQADSTADLSRYFGRFHGAFEA